MLNLSKPRRYESIAQTQLQITASAQALQAFADAGVPAILLKGISLVERVYQAPGERTMGDIDLLIRRQDLPVAESVLRSQGYTFSDEDQGFMPEFARDFMAEIPYCKGTVCIDLHWHLVTMRWYRQTTVLDIDGIWDRAVPARIDAAPALRLCPEDEIIHLCFHTAVHHSLVHSKGYRDIVRVIRAEGVCWNVLAGRACAWRVSTACWAALTVTKALAGDAVPASALEALGVTRWRRRLLRRFIEPAQAGHSLMAVGGKRFLAILLVDRWQDLPSVIWRGLFPGRRWLQTRFALSDRATRWRQVTYPLEILAQGLKALWQVLWPERGIET
jgi:hypothetical protein